MKYNFENCNTAEEVLIHENAYLKSLILTCSDIEKIKKEYDSISKLSNERIEKIIEDMMEELHVNKNTD